MNKKTIFRSATNTVSPNFENLVEISSPSNTGKILIKLGVKKIYLSLDTAEELAHQLLLDIELLRNNKKS